MLSRTWTKIKISAILGQDHALTLQGKVIKD